jgi:Phage capsid family
LSKRYVLPSGREVDVTPIPPGLNLAEHIRYHPMQVLCGCCGGIGCQYCEPEPDLAKTRSDVYALDGPHSFFRDLAAIEEERRMQQGTFAEPRYGRLPAPPQNPPGISWPTAEEAQRRLSRSAREQRDISSSTGSDPDALRPSMPGALAEIFGKAARRTSGLTDALNPIRLEPGMVDNTGSQLVLKAIPTLSTGTAVASHTENASVQETDPTSSSTAPSIASIAGQVDASRQLIEFSQPKMDAVLADDLGARLGEAMDSQIINGSGGAANLRGFLQTSGILSVTGSVTNQAAYVQSLWQAFSQVAGPSGYGDADRTNFLTLIHPRLGPLGGVYREEHLET